MKSLKQTLNEAFKVTKETTRGDIEERQKEINRLLKKYKNKSFANRGEENKFKEKHINPLQLELIELSELWGKVGY